MKKVVLALTAVFATVLGVNAQVTSAKVKVNVVLNPFQSIELGSGKDIDQVTLEYKTVNDYKNGVSVEVPKQLKVSSVGTGYNIKADLMYSGQSGVFGKELGNGAPTVEAKDLLQVAIAKSGAGYGTPQNAGAKMTFTGFGVIGSGASSVLDQELDVKYFGKSLNADMLGKMFGTTTNQANSTAKYTIDVVYTITTN
ncbi:hypothetical protein [Sphingobacterium paucimobilis]|uniref:Uncharacterized protein n=1 Tax=Sphingobacterium paucimobilis HER1398 TaxID=1346330 RepID=U2J8Z3_9SPHI|nr:hypothetical protein [Sphingobacterium paucimobilis]ERJ61404.1 hypothetical protein M472_21850 [Sphingobacterium paucimobilis HER1398]